MVQSIVSETVDTEALAIIAGFVAELGGPRTVGLDDSLDRDLGMGSLERVELLLRLERAFDVRFPDTVLAEAESPRDLIHAVLAGSPAEPERLAAPRAPLPAGVPAPAAARTLPDVLRRHAEAEPDRPHIFLHRDDGDERTITYGDLWARADGLAAGVREHGLEAGERVALMLRTEEAFFAAFFGVLLAGGIPVPIYPPFRADRLEEYAARQVKILRNAEARLLLTFPEATRVAGLLRARVPSLDDVVVAERLVVSGQGGVAPHVATPADPALIQYTSGSTGDPKGVLLSHANLLANIRAIGEAMAIGPGDVAVSWLPLYHDMGLIGSWLGALYFGVPIAIMSPLAFLSRPARWLRAIHTHRATISPAPNFAFDLCVKKIGDDELAGLDLGSWRLALNGSEAVSADTIDRFTRRFAPYGFRAETMCPVYGLAESSVALTVSPVGRGPRVDRIDREIFTQTRQARPTGATSALAFVACGRPLPGHEVRIVDTAGQGVDERIEGHVEFRGPSVTRGYFRNLDATRRACHDGWMDSGDLGYWADGELFITGRSKDIIIKAGRNLYPQEVEEVAGDVPGIRKGCVAGFGVADPAIGTEHLVVVAESRQTAQDARERLRALVVDRVVAALGLPPDIVVIAAPGTVLKTSSGKIRRSATREAYLRGDVVRRRPSAQRQWARLLGQDLAVRTRQLVRAAWEIAFGLWVGVILLFALPALWMLVSVVGRGTSVDRGVKLWCRSVLTLAGCRPRVEGLAHLPVQGAVVLAANHSSYVDAVALLAAIPIDFRFVAKRELTSTPLVRTVIAKVGHLAVERTDLSQSVADAERATTLLRRGVSLLFFPEGTFLRAPRLLPFKLGAFKAAVETGCPVIPVTIHGTRDVLPADTWRPRPGTITVTLDAPITPVAREWRDIVRLRDLTRAAITTRLTVVDEPSL
jgi:1-acyl-sn-glycerol-3-phosphate acyltransferase